MSRVVTLKAEVESIELQGWFIDHLMGDPGQEFILRPSENADEVFFIHGSALISATRDQST